MQNSKINYLEYFRRDVGYEKYGKSPEIVYHDYNVSKCEILEYAEIDDQRKAYIEELTGRAMDTDGGFIRVNICCPNPDHNMQTVLIRKTRPLQEIVECPLCRKAEMERVEQERFLRDYPNYRRRIVVSNNNTEEEK